jgi:hypothetical protein
LKKCSPLCVIDVSGTSERNLAQRVNEQADRLP